MIYADLHVHTNHSDGTEELSAVLQRAKAAGISVLAITDHDTVDHLDEAQALGQAIGVEVIRGVELSCYDNETKRRVHMLGLWLPAQCPQVEALCRHTLSCRDAYHRTLIDNLREQGYDICYEDAKKFSPYNVVFKMNIFQAMKEKYPEEMTTERYMELFATKGTDEENKRMGYCDVEEGIRAVLADGGMPVLAHPFEYDNFNEIPKYAGYGMQGVEVCHPVMTGDKRPKTEQAADQYGLAQSGGSDFHSIGFGADFGIYGLTKEEFDWLLERRNA